MNMERTDHSRLVQSFMTHRLADEDVRALSTGRDAEFRRVMSDVRRSRRAAPGTLQHVVVYGARGFGKSFMMRRVQVELERDDEEPVLFVLLPEEQHNLQRSPHAFLDTIALGLSDAAHGTAESFAEGHFRWPNPKEDARHWSEAATRLEERLDEVLSGRRGLAVVAVENFDILLRTLFRDEEAEQRLRQWLDRRGNRVMILATATGTVDMDYDRPLFKAFDPVRLTPWSEDDCIDYFDRQRVRDRLPPLDAGQRAKARAVATFIGGTPRLAQLLSEVIESQDALSVIEIMTALTDRLAEYYRRRIEDLAPLARGLLDALVRGGEPASQTELAERVGAGGQSDIARVMSDLRRADIVRGVKAPDSREMLYRVTDRVFVHYYRRRQGGENALRSPLETILEFLRTFYSVEERRAQASAHLDAGRVAEAGVFHRLARESAATIGNAYTLDFEYRLRCYFDALPDADESAVDAIVELIDSNPPEAHEWFDDVEPASSAETAIRAAVRAQARYRMGDSDRAEALLLEAVSRNDRDPAARVIAVSELGAFQNYVTHSVDQALETLSALDGETVEDLAPRLECHRLSRMAAVLVERGRAVEAAETATTAVVLARKIEDGRGEAAALRRKSFVLCAVERHDDALEAATEAAALAHKAGDASEESVALGHKSYSLGALGRHDDAVEAATEAAARARAAGDAGEEAVALRYKSHSLGVLGRHDDALEAATEAAALAHTAGDIREEVMALRLKSYSLGVLGRHDDAVEAAAEAAARARTAGDVLEEAVALRHKSYSLGVLGRHDDAMEAATEAAARAHTAGDVLGEAVALRYKSHSLGVLGRHDDALEAATEAAALARTAGDAGEEAEALRLKSWALGALGRHDEAWETGSESLERARSVSDWFSLTHMLRDQARNALRVARPEVIALFEEWSGYWRDGVIPDGGAEPLDTVADFFIASARAGCLDKLDELELGRLVKEYGEQEPVYFYGHYGAVLADIALKEGRAAGYEVMAALLPRIARFVDELPESQRDRAWLVDIVSGFAADCRDAGLLRDVAGLLDETLHPDAPRFAELLTLLADYDEAEDGTVALARVDPDQATLVRRLRGLPAPEQESRAKTGRRKR